MAIVSTELPDEIGLFHVNDGGETEWNVLVRDFFADVVIDNKEQIDWEDDVYVDLRVGGETATVGAVATSSDRLFEWDEEGTFRTSARRDDDSSRIVAQHNAADYDGLPPGEGEWVLRRVRFEGELVSTELYTKPVTVVPEWVAPNVLSLTDCGASSEFLRPGDQTTLSTTIDNPSYDPLAGDAVAFVGSIREPVAFTVPPRGQTSVEATFEVESNGEIAYGFDLENVGHNY